MESKIRILIGKLEYNGGIDLAHVNCKTFNPEPVTYVSLPVYIPVYSEVALFHLLICSQGGRAQVTMVYRS